MNETPDEMLARLTRLLDGEEAMGAMGMTDYKAQNVACLREAIRRWPAQDELGELRKARLAEIQAKLKAEAELDHLRRERDAAVKALKMAMENSPSWMVAAHAVLAQLKGPVT